MRPGIKMIEYRGQPVYESAAKQAMRAIEFFRIFRVLLVIWIIYKLLSWTVLRDVIDEEKLLLIEGSFALMVWFGYLAAFLFLGFWLRQAYKNIAPLGAGKLYFRPLWVLLVFFIPIFHLFLPFYIVDEIWRESEPARIEKDDNSGFKDSVFEYAVKKWWAVYLMFAFFVPMIWVIFAIMGKVFEQELFGLVSNFVLLWWISLSISLIREITRRQQARHDSLEIKNEYTRKPVCTVCNGVLRSKYAKQCPECFLDWHDESSPRYMDGRPFVAG